MDKAEWTDAFERAFAEVSHWSLDDIREFMRQTGDEHWDSLIANGVEPDEAAQGEYDGIVVSQ